MANAIALPTPPMTAPQSSPIQAGAPVSLFMSNGQKLEGELIAFDNQNNLISITRKGHSQSIDFDMGDIKAMQLNTPSAWIPDYSLQKQDSGAIDTPNPCQPFVIEFQDHSKLQGETFGSRVDSCGLHLFKKCADSQYIHIFIPHGAIGKQSLGEPLGDILVQEDSVSREEVENAAEEQTLTRGKPLGDYLVGQKVVNAKQLAEALQRQKAMPQMRLGEILTSEKMISEAQLEEALEEQKTKRKMPLGEILVSKKLVSRPQIQQALAKKVGIPFVHIKEFQILPATIQLVPEDLVFDHRVVPLYEFSDKLAIAMENPLDFKALENLQFRTNKYIEPVMATAEDIDAAIHMYYKTDAGVLDDIEEEEEEAAAALD
ncbi:MAG TPA: hypothetical protein ENK35_07055, partial [Candidatus Tenderia sp.]|nr:hypothetical protein [Candidatus Tenderia sp.]